MNREYFADDADRIAFHRDNEGSPKKVSWWLRSAAFITDDGYVHLHFDAHGVDHSYGIRPALVVNLSSPIFTS
jgi:hypothetical protein